MAGERSTASQCLQSSHATESAMLCSMPDFPLDEILYFLMPSDIFRLSGVCSSLWYRVCTRREYVLLKALPLALRDRINLKEPGYRSSAVESLKPERRFATEASKVWSVQKSAAAVYRSLRCIDVTGVWAVTGAYVDGSTYDYEMTLWTVGRRHGTRELEVFIGGEVDGDPEQKMVIFGKLDADMIVLHEMVSTRPPAVSLPCDIMNICSATMSLAGDRMSGVWFQQIVRENSTGAPVRHMFHIMSSGTFEAKKISNLPELSLPIGERSTQNNRTNIVGNRYSRGDPITIPESDQEIDHVFMVPRSPEFGFALQPEGPESATRALGT